MKYTKYEHIPIKKVRKLEKKAKRLKYKVTTINYTYATNHKRAGSKNEVIYYDKLHYDEYITTLPKLIQWIRETIECAEDIIDIKKVR